MENILSFVIAFLGLSFLIFIHELGHYIVAIKSGMKVEIFSIGFGKPIFSFKVGKVVWQIGSLPFGGFVKIAGMEKSGNQEPQDIKGGFYASSPIKRILVALAGPFVNIAFALIVFSVLYGLGGRIQNFSQHTKIIGFVDPKSNLQNFQIKPGDSLSKIDGHEVRSFQDVMFSSVVKKPKINVQGDHINYFTKQKTPFDLNLESYVDTTVGLKDLRTLGIKAPAQYLIYVQPTENAVINSVLKDSGLEPNDRIVWVNGELIFSLPQLSDVINDNKTLLTVKRGDKVFLTRVPRIKIADLRLTNLQKEELTDRKHALKVQDPIGQMEFIPYDLDSKGFVQSALTFIDDRAEETTVFKRKTGQIDSLLQRGDKIIAVNADIVANSVQIFEKIQQKKVVIITQKGSFLTPSSSIDEDVAFFNSYQSKELSQLISNIGMSNRSHTSGNYKLLNPIQPITKKQLISNLDEQQKILKSLENKLKLHSDNNELEEKKLIAKELYDFNHKLYLGLALADKPVVYNPTPWQQFVDVVKQTKTTFSYLFSGQVSPKWLAGPVGMIQMVQASASLGYKEVLYWIGLISLNLAIFNLLPLPILDGGHVVMAIYEQFTGKPIPSKVKEMIMIPFMVLLIGLIIFVTFHDLSRILSRFFN